MEDRVSYEFVDHVSEDYTCKQCDTVAREPNITSCCGESLCQSCLDTLTQNKNPCPCCEQVDFSAFLHQKYRAKVSALKMRCTKREQGCEWIGEFKQLEDHLDAAKGDCMYITIDCPQNCECQVQKLKLTIHLEEECPNRKFTCPHCSLQDTFRVINEHFNVCQYYPIVCENRCGATFERGELEDHKRLCSLEKIDCEFSFAGCEDVFIREKKSEHDSKHHHSHLSFVARALRDSQEKAERALIEQQDLERHVRELEEAIDRQKDEYEQKLLQKEEKMRQDFEEKLKQRDDKIKECEAKIEEIVKNFVKKAKKHTGIFQCCTWCTNNNDKLSKCGCGSRMSGYNGCGHGHPGHPGCKHWSCCGSTVEISDCSA